MTTLLQRMTEDMQLRGLAPRTQEAYLGAVEQLVKYCGKSPEVINEEDLRQYFLYLRNEKRVARNTMTLALCGVKFCFEHTMGGSGLSLSWRDRRRRRNCRWCWA